MKAVLLAITSAGLATLAAADGCPAVRPQTTTITEEPATTSATTSSIVVEFTSSTSSAAEPSFSETSSSSVVYVAPVTTSEAAATTAESAAAAAEVATTTSPAAVAVAPTTMLTVVLTTSTSSSSSIVVSTSPTSTPVAVATTSTTSTSSSSAAAATTAASASSTTESTSSDGSSASVSGEATFYGGNVAGGACSFSTYTLPSSLFGTAYSGEVWDSAANCGRCVEVTGPSGNSIKAMIVDECPECDEGHLDLFEDAFAELADTSKGIITTSYSFVECGISSPIVLHSKSGTSAYWFSMQVINANEGVASFEVSTDGGSTWQSTTRSDYNFFENASGFGTDTVDVRITSVTGTTVEVSSVSVASDSQTTASSNFA